MSSSVQLLLPRQIHDAMLRQAQAELPNECCGLLGGVEAGGVLRVQTCYPLVNESASPVEYSSSQSLFAATKALRDKREEILAIYHSHPTSAPIPSVTDLERNFYGDTVVHLIIGLAGAAPSLRAWRLRETDFDEADWMIVEG